MNNLAPGNVKFEVPAIDFMELEGAIAQHLEIPLETVRKQVSYRIQN
ncbi:MAG: hypothetical protein HC840_31850 [Leptolyngbyaceae cyanobacterium RM2_2_4]|nr:hypothetical protein [Leptolyngbyaceae cyanobacterium RM2_2_4]